VNAVSDRSLPSSIQIDIYDTNHLNHSFAIASEACYGEAVISASGSGLTAFVCGHATANASTIDIFVASSRLWIVAHRSASALTTGSPLPRDYAGADLSRRVGLYGTNAHLECVAGKVILTSVSEGSEGVSVEVFSGVDGSILSESLLSMTRNGWNTDLEQYQRHTEDVRPSQRETRLLHDNHHDDSGDTPTKFNVTVSTYVDIDRTVHDNRNKEDDMQETMNRNGRLRHVSGNRQFKTRERSPMENREKDSSQAVSVSTRSYMSGRNQMRWKLTTVDDGDGAFVFAGGACVRNFWNCTSRKSTQPPETSICMNSASPRERLVTVYEDVEDPLLATGVFTEYTWVCCDANVLAPMICSVDVHTLDAHTGTFLTSPAPLSMSDDIFEMGSVGGSAIVVDAVNMSNSFWRPSAQAAWERVPTPHPTFSTIPLEGTGVSWPANVALLPHTRATSKESVFHHQSQSAIHFVTEVRLQQECVPLPNAGTLVYRACQVEGWSARETSDSELSNSQYFPGRSKKDYKVSFYRETLSFNVMTGVWSQPTVVPRMVARRQRFRQNTPGNYGDHGGRILPSLVSSITLGSKLCMVWQDMVHDDFWWNNYISSPPPGTVPVAEFIIWDVWNKAWSVPVVLMAPRQFFTYSFVDDPTPFWKSNFFLHVSGEGAVFCQLIPQICTNVDSSGVMQSPSAVIEVSTDSSTITPSEVSLVFYVCRVHLGCCLWYES